MEISLTPNQAVWCHRWSPSHRQRALKKERTQLPRWRLHNDLNSTEMKGKETYARALLLVCEVRVKKHARKSQEKGPRQKTSEQTLFMFPPPSAREQCAACPLVSTLPSEPHMAYLGRRPDTYNSATQKGQFWPHGEHHLRKSNEPADCDLHNPSSPMRLLQPTYQRHCNDHNGENSLTKTRCTACAAILINIENSTRKGEWRVYNWHLWLCKKLQTL